MPDVHKTTCRHTAPFRAKRSKIHPVRNRTKPCQTDASRASSANSTAASSSETYRWERAVIVNDDFVHRKCAAVLQMSTDPVRLVQTRVVAASPLGSSQTHSRFSLLLAPLLPGVRPRYRQRPYKTAAAEDVRRTTHELVRDRARGGRRELGAFSSSVGRTELHRSEV